MSATALNTILLVAVSIGIVWWWKKGFSLPAFSNPLAGGATNTAIQGAVSVQTFVVMAAFAALEFALWHSGWLPKMFEWPGILQIPTYGIFIFITNLVEEKTTGKLKTGARSMMIVAFTILGLGHLDRDRLAAWWNAPPGSAVTTPAPERRVARTPTEPCDNVYRRRTLTSIPTMVTDIVGCTADWNILDGGVIVYGKDGKPYPFVVTEENPMGKTDFHIVRWKSAGHQAIVEIKLYR